VVSVARSVGGMFMYRGFGAGPTAGPGYRTDHLLMMSFDPTLVHYSEAQTQQFFDQVAERARIVSGVTSVTMTTGIPMGNDGINIVAMAPEGFQFPAGKEHANTLGSMVDEYYFDTMGIALVAGRNFRRGDDDGAPKVAIVNQHLAQHYWPNQDPIGKRFRLNDAEKSWVEIVGLAKMSKYLFIAEAPTDFVYM